MAEHEFEGPRVTPEPLKSSGSKAPWIILAVLVVAVLALAASVLLAFFVFAS